MADFYSTPGNCRPFFSTGITANMVQKIAHVKNFCPGMLVHCHRKSFTSKGSGSIMLCRFLSVNLQNPWMLPVHILYFLTEFATSAMALFNFSSGGTHR